MINLFGIEMEPHWWWLILALLLGIAEMVVPGVFLIWIGGAAAVTGMLALLLPIPVAAEFGIFAVASIGAVYAGRRWLAAHPITSADPLLNDRFARMIGREVTVADAIVGGEGRVKVGDGVWNAYGPDAPAGARVKVVGIDDGRLRVEAIETPAA